MKKIKITEEQAKKLGLIKPDMRKNILKITKEQYNRIFAGKLNESMNRVDKSFNQAFAGKDIKNLEENNFDISKPNESVPRSAQGKFGKPIMENESDLRNETMKLIKFLYRESKEFSPFWGNHGVTYEDIIEALKAKNMLISKNGIYKISKSFGTPEETNSALENELKKLISKNTETSKKQIETEASNLPAGAESDPRAPYNQKDDFTKPKTPIESPMKVLAYNSEMAILKSKDGNLYLFYFSDMDKSNFAEYASLTRRYVGRDENGDPEYEYNDDFEIDSDVISNYVNDNANRLNTGVGKDDLENGSELVVIDDELKQELLSLYDKDKNVVKALSGLNELDESYYEDEEFRKDLEMLKLGIYNPDKPKKIFTKDQITNKLKALKDRELQARKDRDIQAKLDWEKNKELEETTSAASSGSFTPALGMEPITRKMPDDINNLNVPVVAENTNKKYTHYAILKDSNKIVNGWDYKGLEQDEIKHYTSLDLKDQFPERKLSDFSVISKKNLIKRGIDPSNLSNWYLPSLNETTAGSGSVGAYDANALPGIKRDGSFKGTKKTNAQKKTQYANGSFVNFNDCVKLNNKPAGSGCSTGAVDNVVKLTKTKGNINAPSLGK